MLLERPGSPRERRRDERHDLCGFPLLAPAAATVVDCGPRGVGIETSSHLAVGSLTTVSVFAPAGPMELVGRVCWARLVAIRDVGEGESEPVFRAGIAFAEGQSLDGWDRLRERVAAGDNRRAARRRRKVVRWQPRSRLF